MTPVLREQRVHEIKAMFLDGISIYDIGTHCLAWGDVEPAEIDRMIAEAGEEIYAARMQSEQESKDWVMHQLRCVYYRACNRKDLSAQVSSLSVIGKFCGISEKNPYRGKLPEVVEYTDEEYQKVLDRLNVGSPS